jgi:hypothetical protein
MPASDEKSASNNAASLDLLEDVMLEEIDAAANLISPLKQKNESSHKGRGSRKILSEIIDEGADTKAGRKENGLPNSVLD